MAKISELNSSWYEWVASRPPVVKAMCEKWPPDRLYRMKSTGSRVTLYSYSENGTVTVNITGEYNWHIWDRRVFGVDPNDLEECDLPAADEPLGTILTEEADVKAYVDMIRPSVLAARGLFKK